MDIDGVVPAGVPANVLLAEEIARRRDDIDVVIAVHPHGATDDDPMVGVVIATAARPDDEG